MWLIKIFGVIYFTALCAAQDDPHDDSSTTVLKPTTAVPTVFEPPVPSLQLQSTWLEVFPSEKVEFSCIIAGSPEWTFSWSKNDQPVLDSDPNVSFSSEGSVLTITAETEMYSGSYTCKGRHKTKDVPTKASNPLQLTVHPKRPKPTVSQSLNYDKIYREESITFRCTVSVSSGWDYLWIHNGKEIQASSSDAYTIDSLDYPNSGDYSCRARRGKIPYNTENSEITTLQVFDSPQPTLRLLTPWKDFFENETVVFFCEVDNPEWTITWHKDQKPLKDDPALIKDAKKKNLNITWINQEDEGVYTCRTHLESRTAIPKFSNPVNITVHVNLPKPTLSKHPEVNPMYVGEKVSFTCSVTVSTGWKYQWYKDRSDLLPETNKTISIQLGPSTGGKYSCKAFRSETTLTVFSEDISLDVLEIPVPSVELNTPWADVFPAERVSLSCGKDSSPDWSYTWYKDDQKVQPTSDVSFHSNGATLSISSASSAHKGKYNCNRQLLGRSVSRNSTSGLTLTVYDKRPSVTLKQDPDYTVMYSEESVSFSCHIDTSHGWKYVWLKDNNRLDTAADNSVNNYRINNVKTTDSGSYKCQAERGTNPVYSSHSSHAINLEVKGNKPKPLMTQRPDVQKVYINEIVSFECKVEHSSGWEYVWHKDGKQVMVSNSFNIHGAKLSDSGTYKCKARRNKTNYNTEESDGRTLFVSEIPVPIIKQVTPWLDVFPAERVTFSCSMGDGSDWTYTWYKDNMEVQAVNDVPFNLDADSLSINSASASHAGQYNCSAKLRGNRSVSSKRSSGLTLLVYETTPRVTLVQSPNHNVMHTGDSVSLSCHINVSSGWEYLWYHDNGPLHVSGNTHNITSVLTTNSGSYKCQTKRGSDEGFFSDQSQVVQLTILERPQAHITLLTGWSDVFSTDSLVLRCEVHGSEDSWNYTWHKGDELIEQQPSERYIVTPQNNPEQGIYTCKGIRTGQPSYSKHSAEFMTKNLLLKRRVLLSISGFIFFGIIAVLIGCIFLRVIRKPAKDEYKPEEADLFLSMSQLKDCADAPCPLVDYVTEAALNSPPKEEDGNGTICSETTPLPIISQEEQVVTTENQEATENNGGLLSFKQ